MLRRFLRIFFPVAPLMVAVPAYLPARVRRRYSALLHYSRR